MKIRRVTYSARAERNLQSILRYIAQKSSPKIASAYVARIRASCEELGLAAFSGEDMGGRLKGLRKTGFERSATIIFRTSSEEVLIVAIFYRGMNVSGRL